MSNLLALCCLPSVKKQKHDFHSFFRSMYIKTIIRFGQEIFGFCDIENNQGFGKAGYQPQQISQKPLYPVIVYYMTGKNECRTFYYPSQTSVDKCFFSARFRDRFSPRLKNSGHVITFL